MRIIYDLESSAPTFENESITKLKEAGHEVFFYDAYLTNASKYNYQTKHFQMYQRLFDYAEKVQADVILLMAGAQVPEYLIYELKSRPKFNIKIILTMIFRGLDRSLARALAVRELTDMPQIIMVPVAGLISENVIYPENLETVGFDFRKLYMFHEPLDQERIDRNSFDMTTPEAREYFGLPIKGTMIMHGGNFNYIKGSDIFAETVKYLDPNIIVLIHRIQKSGDPDFDNKYFNLAMKNHQNTVVVDKFLDAKDYARINCAPDITVFPHRRVYSYGESGIPGPVAFARKLMVAPNIYYFNEIIRRHKFGMVYEPENPEAMANAIHYVIENYCNIMARADFEGYAKNFMPVADIPLDIINEAIKRGVL
jgi:glycosyltransferase involved in cell wall biosynthesis